MSELELWLLSLSDEERQRIEGLVRECALTITYIARDLVWECGGDIGAERCDLFGGLVANKLGLLAAALDGVDLGGSDDAG